MLNPAENPVGFSDPTADFRQQLDDFETFVVGARSEEGGGKADFETAVEGGWVGSKVVALGVFCLLALVIIFLST